MALFDRETQMATPVVRWLREQGGSCVAHEVRASVGVADLVAGVGPRQRLQNRRRQARPVTMSLQLQLLDFCSTTRTEDELREWSPTGMSELRRSAIQPLMDAEMLSEREPGRWRSRRRPSDPFDVLIAVELKLADATRGVAQAYSYRSFAEMSYLALPGTRVSSRVMDDARRHGIGLLAVYPNRVDGVVDPAGAPTALAWRRRMAAELVLEASLDRTRLAGTSPR